MPVVVPSTWDITGVDTCLLTRGVSLSSPGCYGNRLHSLGGQMTWDPGDLKVVCLPPLSAAESRAPAARTGCLSSEPPLAVVTIKATSPWSPHTRPETLQPLVLMLT